MKASLVPISLASMVLWVCGGATLARGEDYTVTTAKASHFVLHAVRVQGVLDDEVRFVQLRGPDRVLIPSDAGSLPHLSGFKIGNPDARRPSKHQWDLPDDSGTLSVTLGDNAYLYAPATAVGNGPSDPIPKGSQYWVAYHVLAASDASPFQDTSDGAGRLVQVAFPAAWWHHAEHEPMADQHQVLLVYESDPVVARQKQALVDPFGLNTMTISTSIGTARQISVGAVSRSR